MDGAGDPCVAGVAEEGHEHEAGDAADLPGAVASVERDEQAPLLQPAPQADLREVALAPVDDVEDARNAAHPASVAHLVAVEAGARHPALDGNPGEVLLHPPEGTESAAALQRRQSMNDKMMSLPHEAILFALERSGAGTALTGRTVLFMLSYIDTNGKEFSGPERAAMLGHTVDLFLEVTAVRTPEEEAELEPRLTPGARTMRDHIAELRARQH